MPHSRLCNKGPNIFLSIFNFKTSTASSSSPSFRNNLDLSNMPFSINCDLITHIIDCVPRTWNYTAGLQEFKTKHRELTMLRGQLYTLKESVISRVDVAETHGLVRTPDVSVWLQDVEFSEEGLNEVLAEGSQMLNRSCLCDWCPCGCWNSEMFLIRVTTEITLVTGLLSRGNFEVVSLSPPPASIEPQPEDPSVGLDSVFGHAWSFIEEDAAGVMGLYGMGGVGKTTLLKKMNNKFLKMSYGFHVVIWVVISKDVNLRGIQNQIGRSLGLSWHESENVTSCARDIFNRLRRKKFVLLLDDIWEQLDLSSIGIPHPKDPNSASKSKVVFTTRSYAVCGLMEADKKIRVNCLNWDEAWELFQTKVGQKSLLDSDPKIRMLAESIAKECDGLPLALIVTSRTMASKKSVEEWNHAVTTLRKYAADFSGMEDKVFLLLQFSYDSLPNDSIRSCFLFCSLYPEDHMIPIEALIQQWIGEGYIDKFDDWQEANDLGHENIGILKAMCLLESADLSTVKMHDVIRDLAHWIACDYGKDKDKILAKNCSGLKEEHEAWKWAKAQSILLWNTGIVAPPDDIPECSRLSTLLFIMPQFWHIPKNIFLSMPTLRVLEVSSITGITLKELPTSIGNLVKLEYLNLSGINFKNKLPEEMKKLVSLKYLFLGDCNVVPLGVIKNLRSLQTLQLDIPGFGDGEEVDRLAGIQEVECLPRLICLQTCIPNLKDLQCFLSKDRLVHCTWDLWIGSKKNDEIRSLIFSPSLYSSACLNLGCMQKMRKLRITDCRKLEELAIDNCRDIALFKCLERLELSNLPELVVSWDGTNRHGSCFTNLRDIEIYRCDSVVNLNWLCLAPRLQVLDVSKCSSMEGIILEEDSGAYDENTFSSLKQLKLSSLPVLKSICSYALPFPSLKDVDIHNCPELKRLSPDSNSAQNSLQPIGGRNHLVEQLRMGK